MTTHNYRVVRRAHSAPDGADWETFRIVEAYYDDDGSQRGCVDGVRPSGESLEELIGDLWSMLDAVHRPVIEEADLR